MARKWLGRRKATKKASAMGPAPSTAAMTTSRMKPEMRETSVHPPTVAMRLIIGGRGPSFPLPACLRGVKQIQHLGQSRTAAAPGGGLWKSESNNFHQILSFVVCDSAHGRCKQPVHCRFPDPGRSLRRGRGIDDPAWADRPDLQEEAARASRRSPRGRRSPRRVDRGSSGPRTRPTPTGSEDRLSSRL